MIKGILDSNEEDEVYLLCVPLKKFSTSFRFIISSTAVFLFFMIYGYVLELIFTLDGMELHGWYLTLIQFGFYSLFAIFQLAFTRRSFKRNIPFDTYVIIAVLTVGTMGFSNSSMGFLNYPTQVIFKSCKLIPVMIGSMIILNKKYNVTQVAACIFMCLGLIWFTLADCIIQPIFTPKGVIFVSMALLCDAIIGNVQEGAMKKHNETSTIVVLYSYSFGFLLITSALIVSGSLIPAVAFSFQHPWEVYGRCIILSLSGFCGVQVVLFLVSQFGALVAVTVTTFRKALSICLSFLLFAKPFTIHYLWGGILVGLGIYLNIVGKNNNSYGSILVPFQKLQILVHKSLSNIYLGNMRLNKMESAALLDV